MRPLFLKLVLVTACSLDSAVFADDSTSLSPLLAKSADFIVRSYSGGPSAAKLLANCRSLRERLQRAWLGAATRDAWRPRCEIVLHATRFSYLQSVGRSGGQTSGSSLIQFEKDTIVTRRIDLLANRQGHILALPHELTHIVLADRFVGRLPPRWLDEGIATLADSSEKRTLHLLECQHALRTGTALPMSDLLKLEQFTTSAQIPSFYGQSLSLVCFLAEQDDPRKIISLSEIAKEKGYEYALKQCYGINGVSALERQWRDYAMTPKRRHARVSFISNGKQP